MDFKDALQKRSEQKKQEKQQLDRDESLKSAITQSTNQSSDKITESIHDLLLATVVGKDPRIAEFAEQFSNLLNALKEASDNLENSALEQLPQIHDRLVEALEELPSKLVESDRTEDLFPYLEDIAYEIGRKNFNPTVNVKAPDVDLKPLEGLIASIRKSIEDKKDPEIDISSLEDSIKKVESAIKNIVFPVPEFPLPFQNSAGRGVQPTLTSDGAIPVDLVSGDAITLSGNVEITNDVGNPIPVSASSLPLPSGASTSAKQDTVIGHLDGVETLLTDIESDTDTLAVVGGGTEAAALRVTIANNSTGVLGVDDNGGSLTVDGTVDTELPAAVTLADNTATPTAPAVGSFLMGYDSSTWDFIRTASALGDNNSGTGALGIANYYYDGSTWDRMRGDSTDGLLVNLGANNDVSLNAGTNTIGKLAANSGVDIGDVDVTSMPEVTLANVKDGAGDSVMDATNNAMRVNIVAGAAAGGTSSTDDAAFTAAAGAGTPAMGFVTSDSVDSGDVGVLGMLANRQLKVTLFDSGGSELSVGGGTQYTEDAAATANPVGNALNLIRDDARGGSLTTTDGDNVAARGTNAGELYVKHVDAIPITDNSGSLTVDNGGTFAVQDSAAEASLSVIDDWDESDRAKVNPIVGQAGVAAGSGTVGTTTQRVVLATDVALPAGTNAIGKLAANSGVDIGDVDVTSIIPGSGATNLGKAEDGGHSSGDVGVMALGVNNVGAANAFNSTDLDYTPIATDGQGRTYVTKKAPTATLTNVNDTNASTTLLSAATGRLGWKCWNDSTAILYIKYGSTASATSCTYKLNPDDQIDVEDGYTGIITGIWSADASGAARLTELT